MPGSQWSEDDRRGAAYGRIVVTKAIEVSCPSVNVNMNVELASKWQGGRRRWKIGTVGQMIGWNAYANHCYTYVVTWESLRFMLPQLQPNYRIKDYPGERFLTLILTYLAIYLHFVWSYLHHTQGLINFAFTYKGVSPRPFSPHIRFCW